MLVAGIKDFQANAKQRRKFKHTQSWTKRRHELRMENGHKTIDGIPEQLWEQAQRANRGRKFVENLTHEERRIVKARVAEAAIAAEKRDKQVEKSREEGQ